MENFREFGEKQIIAQFRNQQGHIFGPQIQIPLSFDKSNVSKLLKEIIPTGELKDNLFSFYVSVEDESIQNNSNILNDSEDLDDIAPSSIFQKVELITNLSDAVNSLKNYTSEKPLQITFYPLNVFNVDPVTRCTTTLQGHKEAILCVQFSVDGNKLATGSGDCSVKIWDIMTETPTRTFQGHRDWVLCVSWNLDCNLVASGGMDGILCIWDTDKGKEFISPLIGHKQPITSIIWQPFHLITDSNCGKLPWIATGSRDSIIRIWDVFNPRCLFVLSSHTKMITSIRWSGEDNGYLYSSSRDTMIKVWNTTNGKLIKDLKGHAHWVDTLSLNTDQILRVGYFDYSTKKDASYFKNLSIDEKIALARKNYQNFIEKIGGELLVSGSDDFTMFLWSPLTSRKSIYRFHGHQQTINQVSYSPDGKFIASASFDKSIRIWDGKTGKYIGVLRGHVAGVYQLCFSPNSKMIVSCSKDSTLKLWDMNDKNLKFDLPGHVDEVYAVDWSPNGRTVASGSKDRCLKIWRN